MKLNSNSQFGLNISQGIVDRIMDSQWNGTIKNLDEKRQLSDIYWLCDLFSSELKGRRDLREALKVSGSSFESLDFSPNKNYLVAQTAMEMAKKIKIDEDKFDVKFLHKVKDQKITFLLGEQTFVRYIKRANIIFALRVDAEKVGDIGFSVNYTIFKINTETGDVDYPNKPDAPLTNSNFKFFVQLLVFTELSKLEIKILNPKEKFGTRKSGKYINESNQKIVVIDSVWNTISVRNVGFDVSGHWRWQRKGAGYSDVEYIFIDGFRKKGYVRGAKKETLQETI